MRILGGGARSASDAPPFIRKPSYAFVDADNFITGFRSTIQRCGLAPDHAVLLNPIDMLLRWKLDRYFIFSALPSGERPNGVLQQLQSTERCVLRTGRLVSTDKKNKQEGVDVRLAIEAMQHAFSGNMVSAWIYSGDGDLIPLVDALVDAGVFVTVASFGDPNQGEVSPMLRDKSDRYEWMRANDIYSLCVPREYRFMDYAPAFHDKADLLNPNRGHDFATNPVQKYEIEGCTVVRFKQKGGGMNMRTFASQRSLEIWEKLALEAELDDRFYFV